PLARLARQPLARLIAANRAKKVQHHYAEIGGKSPIREMTARQAVALQAALEPDLPVHVTVAMRYWHPMTAEAIQELEAARVKQLVLLPLYPHYSCTTTGSSLNEWNRLLRKSALGRLPVHLIREFYTFPGYLDALVEHINATLARFEPGEAPHLVFSAHNV